MEDVHFKDDDFKLSNLANHADRSILGDTLGILWLEPIWIRISYGTVPLLKYLMAFCKLSDFIHPAAHPILEKPDSHAHATLPLPLPLRVALKVSPDQQQHGCNQLVSLTIDNNWRGSELPRTRACSFVIRDATAF